MGTAEQNNADADNIWKKRFERERELRKEAERLLEQKSLEIYEMNQSLEDKIQISTEELRQNNEELIAMLDFVNEQKEVIAKKSDSIKKSMDAALRIQNAILPTDKELSSVFSKHFLMNMPRDVVSGDFLWVHERGARKIVVLADCTGHGVPGAFMSVIGHALLNKIVIDNDVFLPDHILYYLNLFLSDFFRRSNNLVREGMDVGVCVYNSETKTLKYAGAMNPLYYCAESVFYEIRGDKKSAGGVQGDNEERIFSSHEIKVKSDSVFYLLTDGYQDQFGGEENRKFLTKNLRSLLFKVHELPMKEQQAQLYDNFVSWKGKNDQVDDILILGFSFD